jgi:hypothetical protein
MKENPKSIPGRQKDSYSFIPWNIMRGLGIVMKSGAVKYGRFNWRQDKITLTDYEDSLVRHFVEWIGGSDADKDSGMHPLYHVMATCAVILDAKEHDSLIDDRLKTESK